MVGKDLVEGICWKSEPRITLKLLQKFLPGDLKTENHLTPYHQLTSKKKKLTNKNKTRPPAPWVFVSSLHTLDHRPQLKMKDTVFKMAPGNSKQDRDCLTIGFQSLWIIINYKLIDVERFLSLHPSTFTSQCGKYEGQVTEAWKS